MTTPAVAAGVPATLLKEIGVTYEYNASSPWLFTTLGATTDAVFFARTDAGNIALFRTDGTPGGTVLLCGFVSPLAAAPPLTGGMVPFGGGVLFTVAGADSSWEVWSSDGTAAGTVRVKAVPAADGSGFFQGVPDTLAVAGGKVLFSAYSTGLGQELWATDGTAAGTALVKDIFPGAGAAPNSSYPAGLRALGDIVVFSADDGVGGGQRLWKSDGTEPGTVRVVPSGGPAYPGSFSLSQGQMFFTASGQASFGDPPQVYNPNEVWRTDGTEAGTRKLMNFAEEETISGFPPMNGMTVFCRSHRQAASLGGLIQEIPGAFYQTDGTVAGTTQILSFGSNNSTLSPTRLLGVLSGGVLAYVARGDGLFPNHVSRLASLGSQGANQLAAGEVGSAATLGGALYVTVRARYGPEYLYRYLPTDAPDHRLRMLGVMSGPILHTAGGKLYAAWHGPETAPTGIEPWRVEALTGLPVSLGNVFPGFTQHRTVDGP